MSGYKDIFCKKCGKYIDTIPVDRPHYNPCIRGYIEVSFHDFYIDWYLPILPEGKGYEFNHYYHFECWDKEVRDFPKIIDIKDKK
jgi:hypothetical protein